jgi:chromosome transmission fidelity protein 18
MQVNHQVIKKEEKYLLSRVVDVMVALELRFVQEKQDDGQMTYRLDPCVKHYMRSSIADTIF